MKTPKKATVASISLLLAVLLGGCGVLSAPAAGEPAATPVEDSVSIATTSPPPAEATPVPEIVVFGAEASRSFQEGLANAAAQGEFAVSFISGGLETLASYKPSGSICAVVYWNDPSDTLPTISFPIFAFAAHGQTGVRTTPLLVYDASGAAESALKRAIAYPPHETPVRLIGLFSSETSPGYTAWKAAAEKGSIFSKAEFFLNDLEMLAASVWFAERLDEFYPGMIDAVYAETGNLAIAAVHQLRGRPRADMEVFSCSSDAEADLSLSSLMPVVVGADLYKAGELCYESAAALLQGKTVESSVLFPSILEYKPDP